VSDTNADVAQIIAGWLAEFGATERLRAYEECARIADEYGKAQMAAAFRMDVNFPHNGNRYVAADAAHYLANTIRKAAKGGAA
jgi:hypothetical protein